MTGIRSGSLLATTPAKITSSKNAVVYPVDGVLVSVGDAWASGAMMKTD